MEAVGPVQRNVGAATTRRSCPLCDSTQAEPRHQHDGWRLVECAKCSLVYMPEIPSESAIETDFEWSESFARERYERWKRNPFARLWTLLVLGLKPSREGRAMRRIRRYATPGRMLDVGCGDGRLAAVAMRHGFDPLGVELSPKMAARAVRRLGKERVLCGRLESFELEPGSLDLITSVSYMEHEPRPLEASKRLRDLLRPGGVCAHKVPNYASRLRRILGSRWSGFRWPEHVQYFTPRTLSRLLESTGFEILSIDANPYGDNFWIFGRRPVQ